MDKVSRERIGREVLLMLQHPNYLRGIQLLEVNCDLSCFCLNDRCIVLSCRTLISAL